MLFEVMGRMERDAQRTYSLIISVSWFVSVLKLQ